MLPASSRARLLALLPDFDKTVDPETSEPTLASQFFVNNTVLQDTMRALQDDLENGRYTKTYSNELVRARKHIEQGGVDEYKDGQFELWWGQRAREDE